ncbi:MAG: DMT family transporter [Christensenellales bacterium]
MGKNRQIAGNLTALLTIAIWGTTFISTKVLLSDFTPAEIMFYRFCIGLAALLAAYPHRLRIKDKKQELLFAAAGLCGVTLYFLMENIALTYTLASNVGVIVSVAPFFTALSCRIFLKEEKLHLPFFVGFVVAMAGIFLISFNGSVALKVHPIGDMLALGAAAVWALYAVLSKKISALGYPMVQSTRRIFAYGLLFMTPALFIMKGDLLNIARFAQPKLLLNILFLGLGASALCYVTWNVAVKILGPVKTSVYIYLIPVITVVTSAIVLKETITPVAMLGTALILLGLVVSRGRLPQRKQQVNCPEGDLPEEEV